MTSRSNSGCLTTRWSRPGQPEVAFSAILALPGRAAHLEAVGRPARYTQDGPNALLLGMRYNRHIVSIAGTVAGASHPLSRLAHEIQAP